MKALYCKLCGDIFEAETFVEWMPENCARFDAA